MKYQALRGTKDILPQEAAAWQRMEAACRSIFAAYGYGEIRTPVIEETALFTKSVGEDTDIVKKEMFSFVDRGERNISLRPEGTAPIVRAYLENNLDKTEPFQKLYYIEPMFRAERPQAGRLRQFHQAGVEAIGSNLPALDAEVITLLSRLLEAIGVQGCKIKINNLGCAGDKKKLSAMLKESFSKKDLAKLMCDDCKRRAATNPLRLLDCKVESCRVAVRRHVSSINFICAECNAHFAEVLKYLDIAGVKYTLDPYIVRGLDYYTRTVFEAVSDKLGAQDAVGAGGRYDNLISDMGGTATGACGFAIGLDRAMLAGGGAAAAGTPARAKVFIAALGKAASEKSFAILQELRRAGIACDMDYEGKSLKAQMRAADKMGAGIVCIIGDDELKSGSAMLRDMKTKAQKAVKFNELAAAIKEIC